MDALNKPDTISRTLFPGGETSLDNLVLLCRFHHRLVHEGGFGCERNDEGQVDFTNAYGLAISKAAHTMPTYSDGVVVDLKQRLEDRHIHAQTVVTQWDGDRMDHDLAVSHLWEIDRPCKHR